MFMYLLLSFLDIQIIESGHRSLACVPSSTCIDSFAQIDGVSIDVGNA